MNPTTTRDATGHNPLTGANDDRLGPRFPDMTDAYSPRLRSLARAADPTLTEGVYCGFAGPTYETPAEVRMAGVLGADLVGMSTVLETIAARHAGAITRRLVPPSASGSSFSKASTVRVGCRASYGVSMTGPSRP